MSFAKKSDWQTKPLPKRRITIPLSRTFSQAEFERIRQGLIPEQMEDKWFIYWENERLYFHRSWTGFCIYVVRFASEGDSHRLVEAEVNRNPKQYEETSDKHDAEMVSWLIDVLLLQQDADFPSDEPYSDTHKVWPRFVTTPELAAITAGGDDYIRTKGNEVKGLALRYNLNPDAPDAVVYGKGPRVQARAELLLQTGAVVPAYVKRQTNEWEYLGQYRATAIRRDASAIRKYGYKRVPGTVGGVLFLESVDEPQVQVSSGGFADPQTRKEIESAAIAFVTQQLDGEGFTVHDHQRENRGYDLLAQKRTTSLLVEVKGTDASLPRFFLTRNESRCAKANANWRLYVVCRARTTPVLYKYTDSEMRASFKLDPLAWECTQTDS